MRSLYLELDREYPVVMSWIVRLLDLGITLGSGILAFFLVFSGEKIGTPYTNALFLSAVLTLSIFPFFDVYRTWRGLKLANELTSVFLSWCTIFFTLVLASIVTNSASDYSENWFLLWFVIGSVLFVVTRLIMRSVFGLIRRSGLDQRRIVLVGASGLGRAAAERVRTSPWYGYKIVGFFSDLDGVKSGDLGEGVPFLGSSSNVAEYVSRYDIDQVWVAMSMEKAATIKSVISSLDKATVDVCFVPDIFSFSLLNHSVTDVGDIPLLNISVSPMKGVNRLVKAILDRVLASIILLMISPLMIVLAIGVKLSSPGPVFYRQERVSWNGKTFNMLKFRSMPVDSEKNGVKWGGSKDKAVHPFGQFIRKTSLDELPQFINVLLGHMSIVGPRPERTVFVERFKDQIPGYMKKHKVKAGITGWAQINGWRGDTDLTKRVECDLYYIQNWSPWLDLKIIFLTLIKGFINKNAY